MADADEEMQFEMKIFLKDFLKTKLQLEEHIKELRLAADKIDKIHKNCTITYKVAKSAGAVSGFLTLAGVALTPVTAGASLAFSVGIGLGLAAAFTGVSAKAFDHANESLVMSQLDKVEEETKDILLPVSNSANTIVSSLGWLVGILTGTKSPDLRPAKAKSGLSSTISQMNKHCKLPVLATNENPRVRRALSRGVNLLMDIGGIVEDYVHSSNGAKATTAEKLRGKSQNLEEKVQELSKIYQILLETDTQ